MVSEQDEAIFPNDDYIFHYTNILENELIAHAIEFARRNKKSIAKELTNPNIYLPDETPVSVFMAGSPGAGKTEFSKNLLNSLETNITRKTLRIDGDELRILLPGYTGNNSYLFQGAVSIIVEKMHDTVLEHSQSFLLDGTLSKYEKAAANIQRSLDKGRLVFIFYVYQKPDIAWRFTEQREKAEGRNIPKEKFIEQFLGAKQTVARIHEKFGAQITIYLVKKDFEKNTVEGVVEIGPKNGSIDDYIKDSYTLGSLEKLL